MIPGSAYPMMTVGPTPNRAVSRWQTTAAVSPATPPSMVIVPSSAGLSPTTLRAYSM